MGDKTFMDGPLVRVNSTAPAHPLLKGLNPRRAMRWWKPGSVSTFASCDDHRLVWCAMVMLREQLEYGPIDMIYAARTAYRGEAEAMIAETRLLTDMMIGWTIKRSVKRGLHRQWRTIAYG